MNGGLGEMRIVRARERSLDEINVLIARSKAHWHWPPGYLKAALTLSTVTAEYVKSNSCFEIFDAHERLIAFFSVLTSESRVVLDNL